MILLAALPSLAATQAPAETTPAQVAVGAVRSYRQDRTLINGFVRIPHALLDAVTIGAGGFAEFRLDVAVVDARGNSLATDSWTRRVPWLARPARGAASVEMVTFTVDTGDYEIRAIVKDSASGRQSTATLPVHAFKGRPSASDLLLASEIRRARYSRESGRIAQR
jgi:hypothetical protein